MKVYLGSQCQQVRQSDLKCFSVSKRQGQNSAKDQSSERYKRQKDQKRKRSDHGLSMICASQRPVSAQISFKQEISFSDQMRARCNYSISTSLYAMSRCCCGLLLLHAKMTFQNDSSSLQAQPNQFGIIYSLCTLGRCSNVIWKLLGRSSEVCNLL